MANLVELLQYVTEQRASDLLVKVGSPPHLRVDGKLVRSTLDAMKPADIEAVCAELLPAGQAATLGEHGQVDVAHSVPGLGRFRVNAYRQRGSLSLAIRRVVPGAPSLADLHLPPSVERLADAEDGLVIVAGPAASGRTTTASALIDHINISKPRHIVTIEDPIEVLHADRLSLVSQREVGVDTASMVDAIKRVGRQGADVLYVSEVRDGEAAVAMLAEAASGRLVLTTMATLTAAETLNRMIEMCPAHQQRMARATLANALRGVVCQQLVPRADGQGRWPAVEVLVNTSKVSEALASGQDEDLITRLVAEGQYHGMQTFDRALFDLYSEDKVTAAAALAAAVRPEELRIAFQQAGLTPAY